MTALKINADAIWRRSDPRECGELYSQFARHFHGNFKAIRAYYGWKRKPMLRALRIGQASSVRIQEREGMTDNG